MTAPIVLCRCGDPTVNPSGVCDACETIECVRCHAPDVWDGEDESGRLCGECRAGDADFYFGERE